MRDEDILSPAGWTPDAGRILIGGAAATYVDGRLVAEGRKVLGEPGAGRFLSGPGVERGTAPAQ